MTVQQRAVQESQFFLRGQYCSRRQSQRGAGDRPDYSYSSSSCKSCASSQSDEIGNHYIMLKDQ